MNRNESEEITTHPLVGHWAGSPGLSGLNHTHRSTKEKASGEGARTFLEHCQGALEQVTIP